MGPIPDRLLRHRVHRLVQMAGVVVNPYCREENGRAVFHSPLARKRLDLGAAQPTPGGNMRSKISAAVGTICATLSSTAHADVTISSAATQKMSCSSGVCMPTASSAVLNVTDLENLLASGSVKVTTTGSSVQADNIDMDAALAWSSQIRLRSMLISRSRLTAASLSPV